MRQLAAYSFERNLKTTDDIFDKNDVEVEMLSWLESKGDLDLERSSLTIRDGRNASVEQKDYTSSVGNVSELTLTEPTNDGWFRTTISVGQSDGTVAVAVTLSAGSESFAPLWLDVHCPRMVRKLLTPPSGWTYRGLELSSAPVDFLGRVGGDAFIELVWADDRPLPVLAIADEYGAVLHPGIVEALANDLAGLAVVARLDPDASWQVTRQRQKEWSCYGGAIRLYWPGLDSESSPFSHPLWTPRRLLTDAADTETAADRIRRQLRRRVLSQSPFAILESPIFAGIRQAARKEELESLREQASVEQDYEKLADEYFEKAVAAREELEEREREVEKLKSQIANLQYALQWRAEESGDVEPDEEVPPSTVREAVNSARERFRDALTFGESVDDGIETLAATAGPPDKILDYLSKLADLALTRRRGSLGTTAVKWLEERGALASIESEAVRNSSSAQQARTWDDGTGNRRFFDTHMKPKEAVAPDQCVRIYFDFDEGSEKVVIGWVGRHP